LGKCPSYTEHARQCFWVTLITGCWTTSMTCRVQRRLEFPVRGLLLRCAVAAGSIISRSPARQDHCGAQMSFPDFVKTYKRSYTPGTEEYDLHQELFTSRVVEVRDHNCGRSGRLWRAGINNLADWKEEDLEHLLGSTSKAGGTAAAGLLHSSKQVAGAEPLLLARRPRQLPASYSWGHLSEIKRTRHQGHCGSCWAVTAVSTMAAHAEIKGRLHDFSLSQVVACTPNPRSCGGTGGCHGATAELAFDYALRVGLLSEQSFPYPWESQSGPRELTCPQGMGLNSSQESAVQFMTTKDGLTMHTMTAVPALQIGMSGWASLPENKEKQLLQAVVEHGPVAVSVATGKNWRYYMDGIMNSDECDPEYVMRHAVVLYGYGAESNTNYWHLKNSWGPDWGESGNMRLQRVRDEENRCGWDKEPSKGSGCIGGPDKVWVCGSCGILYHAAFPLFS